MNDSIAKHRVWDMIDGILVINLDVSTDRMEAFRRVNSAKLPLDRVERLSAVPGLTLPTYGKPPWFTEQTGERARFWGGTAGCALSHRKAIERSKAAGWRNVLILEDDACVTAGKDELDLLQQVLGSQRGDYMLYLGFNRPEPYGWRLLHGESTSLWQVEGVLATHAYLLPACMYDKVLSLLPLDENVWEWLTRYRAVDSMYRDYLSTLPGVRILALYPGLVAQAANVSDIGGTEVGSDFYSCNRPPRSYCSIPGIIHLLATPCRRFKVYLNSLRTRRRGRKSGLPGFRNDANSNKS